MPSDQSKKNLELWNKLERTNPRYTKTVEVDRQQRTTIKPLYNVKRVTAALGPVGFAWGWHLAGERYETFGVGESAVTVHTAHVCAWFRQDDGTTRRVDGIGCTQAAYWTRPKKDGDKARFIVDVDAAKKSLTDALSKIMSTLGASADIWLGIYDPNWKPPATEPQPAPNAAEPVVEHDEDGVLPGDPDDTRELPTEPEMLAAERDEPRAVAREARDPMDPLDLRSISSLGGRIDALESRLKELVDEQAPAAATDLFRLYEYRLLGKTLRGDQRLAAIRSWLEDVAGPEMRR